MLSGVPLFFFRPKETFDHGLHRVSVQVEIWDVTMSSGNWCKVCEMTKVSRQKLKCPAPAGALRRLASACWISLLSLGDNFWWRTSSEMMTKTNQFSSYSRLNNFDITYSGFALRRGRFRRCSRVTGLLAVSYHYYKRVTVYFALCCVKLSLFWIYNNYVENSIAWKKMNGEIWI